jgi:hypothetical protein
MPSFQRHSALKAVQQQHARSSEMQVCMHMLSAVLLHGAHTASAKTAATCSLGHLHVHHAHSVWCMLPTSLQATTSQPTACMDMLVAHRLPATALRLLVNVATLPHSTAWSLQDN